MTPDSTRDYWEDRLADACSLAGVGYTGLGEGFNAAMYRVRRELFLRRMAPLVEGRETLGVLDVGSGTGFYVEAWEELGASSITGVDITDAAVSELARRFPGHSFLRADIGAERPPFPEEAFDVVSAFDVLFHIVDDDRYRRAFANARAALRAGGLLVFTENLLHGPAAARATRQVSRTLDETQACLAEAGFELLQRRPVFVLMNKPFDSDSRLLDAWWRALAALVRLHPPLGAVAGSALVPLELALATRIADGPSTEMVICRKHA